MFTDMRLRELVNVVGSDFLGAKIPLEELTAYPRDPTLGIGVLIIGY